MRRRLPILVALAALALAAAGPAGAPPQAQAACTDAAAASDSAAAGGGQGAAALAGRIDLFARGTDNALWHRWWDLGSPWTCWQSLRGDLASAPAVASHDPNVVHLNALGGDGRIQDRSFLNSGGLSGGWSNWSDLGAQRFVSAPAIESWGPGHLEIFALDETQKIQHKWYRFGGGGWSAWYGFTGEQKFQGAPAAAAYQKDRLHLFARGIDNKMYQRYQTSPGVWGGWETMGDKRFTSSPAAVSWGPGHLEVFALGEDSKLWHKWYDFGAGRWTDWYILDGAQTFKEAPTAVSWAPGRVNVFALGSDDRMWTRHLTGEAPGQWSAWAPMGDEKFTSAPAAASWTKWVNR